MELATIVELCICWLPNIMAAGHLLILTICNMAGMTEELDFKCHLILLATCSYATEQYRVKIKGLV